MTATKPEQVYVLAWLLLSAWLVFCAIVVQGEYGDGYQTIVNARYLFADSSSYYVQRGPLAAVALWPVEIIVQAFDLDPVDVRPYHLLSAVLHSAYLAGCWLLLKRAPGGLAARLIGFAAAILSVIFYAYSPFLSHDILPGLLFLGMIFLTQRWLRDGNRNDAIVLVLLGAAVTLIKQTYAIFWIAIIVYALLAWLLRWDAARMTLRRLLTLGALGAASAVISWTCYAWFVGGELPQTAFLTRPLQLITAVSTQYGDDMAGTFATDLYLRNLHNYGIAAMLLILPGLVMAIRGSDARMQQIAICWLIAACVMQLIGFREARYLGFLAPLTAMLIVPVIQSVLTRRPLLIALLLVLGFDQLRGVQTAVAPLAAAAKVDVARFINSPTAENRIVSSEVLSFAYAAESPLRRDRYHGLWHLTPELLRGLYQHDVEVARITDPRALAGSGIQAGDRVFYSNNTLVRRPPWPAQNVPAELASFLLVAGDAMTADLVLQDDAYQRRGADGSYIMYLPADGQTEQMPVITPGALPSDAARRLYGESVGERVQVTAVLVTALCQADRCSYR